jgi:hypothetical protein
VGMALTKQDLSAIGNLIDQKLDQKFKKELKPIKKDLKDIKDTQNLMIGQFDMRLNKLEHYTTHPPKTAPYLST